MGKFNELNLELQGKNHHIAQMISKVKAFRSKLALWKSHISKNNLVLFPNLKNIYDSFANKNITIAHFAHHFDTLLEEFSSRFQEFSELDSFIIFFVNPFTSTDEYVSDKIANYFQMCDKEHLELEIINLKNDIILKSHQNDELFWNLVDKNSYPLLRKCALKISSYCASTYSCESLFSHMKHLKSKYRSRLTDAHLEHCLRAGTSTHIPDYKKLADEMQCQVSH